MSYSATDEIKLIKDFHQTGSVETLNELISMNKPLVQMTISKKFDDISDSFYDDVFQEGMIGLMRAFQKGKLKSYEAFVSYKILCIRNSIIDFLRKENKFTKAKNKAKNKDQKKHIDFGNTDSDIFESVGDVSKEEKIYREVCYSLAIGETEREASQRIGISKPKFNYLKTKFRKKLHENIK